MILYQASISLCMLIAGAAGSSDGATDELKRKLLSEGPSGWKRIEEREQRILGRLHYEATASLDGVKNQDWSKDKWYDFKRNGDLTLTSYKNATHPGLAVFVEGLQYSFELERTAPDKSLLIRNLSFGVPNPKDSYFKKASQIPWILQSPYRLCDFLLEEIIASPEFVVTRATKSTRGSREFLKFEFTTKIGKGADAISVVDAWMELCPLDDWSLQGGEYVQGRGHRTTVSNEYRPDSGSKLAVHTMTDWYPAVKNKEVRKYTFEDLDFKTVPNSEFTLSAFGLPEPTQPVVRGGLGLHYWFIGLAVVLMILALALRWRANHTGPLSTHLEAG